MSDAKTPTEIKPKYTSVRVTGLFTREYGEQTKLSGKTDKEVTLTFAPGTIIEVVENQWRTKDTQPQYFLNKVVREDSEEGKAELARRAAAKAAKAATAAG